MVLNPDHMPLILGIEKGWFKEQDLEIEMIEPEEHFDALDEIEKVQWISQLQNLSI